MTLSLQRIKPYLARGLGITASSLDDAFRPAIEQDLLSILKLRQEVLGENLTWNDEKYVRWRFFDNPRKRDGEVPYWVFKKEGVVIGGLGLENVDLLVEGAIHPAVRCFDIMARPDYEGRGLGAFMNMVILEQFPTALVLNTNEKSTDMVTKLFHRMNDLSSFVAIGRTKPFLDKHLHLGFMAKPLGYLADRILKIVRRLKRSSHPVDLEFRQIERFDHEVDEICKATAQDRTITVRRDSFVLNWRFLDNPRKRYEAFGAFFKGMMLGYVVTCLNPAQESLVRKAKISDWRCRETTHLSGNTLKRMLFQQALDRLFQSGAEIVRCLTSEEDSRKALKASGLFLRPQEGCPFFIQSSCSELKKKLAESDRWFVNGFDNDED